MSGIAGHFGQLAAQSVAAERKQEIELVLIQNLGESIAQGRMSNRNTAKEIALVIDNNIKQEYLNLVYYALLFMLDEDFFQSDGYFNDIDFQLTLNKSVNVLTDSPCTA